MGNQNNFWQDFLVQIAGQIPEKIARIFFIGTPFENRSEFPENRKFGQIS